MIQHEQLRRQVRAGRELLGMTQGAVAELMGVSLSKISRAESGDSKSIDTLLLIKTLLDTLGVELTDDGGVRPKQSTIEKYVGRDGFKNFFDDVYYVARTAENPDICVTNVKEQEFIFWHGDHSPVHVQRMSEIEGLTIRALLHEGDKNSNPIDYAQYRWVTNDQFADVALYLYANKTAFIEFAENNVVVTLTDSIAITDTIRKMFETTWNFASEEKI